MKHLLFIGKRGSGKSLFAKMIFGIFKTFYVDGKNEISNPFFLDNGQDHWDYENIVIDDITAKFNISRFYEDFGQKKMILNRRGKNGKIIKTPRFILIIDSQNDAFLNDKNFIKEFHVIDFDKNTIADLKKILNEEKIIIKTDY